MVLDSQMSSTSSKLQNAASPLSSKKEGAMQLLSVPEGAESQSPGKSAGGNLNDMSMFDRSNN